MGEILGFFHGGITVKDLQKSLKFYHDGLGLKVKFEKLLNGPYLRTVVDLSSYWTIKVLKNYQRHRVPAISAAGTLASTFQKLMKSQKRCSKWDTSHVAKVASTSLKDQMLVDVLCIC